jgi:nucleotide-binding universal stress UspA family protein
MHILVPLDFSDSSLLALEAALALATGKKDRISLVHVVEAVYDFASQAAITVENHQSESKKLAKKIIQSHVQKGVRMDYLQKEGNPTILIAQTALEQKVDLIVMGTKGASGLKKSLIGTVTVGLLKEAPCPVLVVPAQASLASIRQFTVALAYANHEPPMLEKLVRWTKTWKSALQVVHVQDESGIATTFKEELMTLGMKSYLAKKFPKGSVKLITRKGEKVSDALADFMEEQGGVLVMCHADKSIWEQLIKKSQSLQMAFQTKVPLLIIN